MINYSTLREAFLATVEAVIIAFEELPNSTSVLNQFFSRLLLPIEGGKLVPLLNPSTQVFRRQSRLWNSFSPHLLKMIAEECRCSLAIAAIEQFLKHRRSCSSLLVSRWVMPIDLKPLDCLTATLHPSHLATHCRSNSVDDFQSTHPSMEEKSLRPSPQHIRLSALVNRTHLTLQDYDDITDAVCGFFHIPRVGLTYEGCSSDHVVSWTASSGLMQYIRRAEPSICHFRLLAELDILGLAAEDVHYRCLSLKVSKN